MIKIWTEERKEHMIRKDMNSKVMIKPKRERGKREKNEEDKDLETDGFLMLIVSKLSLVFRKLADHCVRL